MKNLKFMVILVALFILSASFTSANQSQPVKLKQEKRTEIFLGYYEYWFDDEPLSVIFRVYGTAAAPFSGYDYDITHMEWGGSQSALASGTVTLIGGVAYADASVNYPTGTLYFTDYLY